jgi:hypothetical protein
MAPMSPLNSTTYFLSTRLIYSLYEVCSPYAPCSFQFLFFTYLDKTSKQRWRTHGQSLTKLGDRPPVHPLPCPSSRAMTSVLAWEWRLLIRNEEMSTFVPRDFTQCHEKWGPISVTLWACPWTLTCKDSKLMNSTINFWSCWSINMFLNAICKQIRPLRSWSCMKISYATSCSNLKNWDLVQIRVHTF